MGRSLKLEEFSTAAASAGEQEDAAAALELRLKAAWDAGHAAGQRAGAAAAAQAHAEDQSQLRQTLVEALRDQKQSQIEVQQAMLRDIGPFVRAVTGHLAPRLALTGLADHIGQAVTTALLARPDPVPVVRCAPEAVAPLRAALSDWEDLQLTEDPTLTPLEAEVHWDNGYDAISISSLLNHIDAALDAELGRPAERAEQETLEPGDFADAG